MSDVFLSYAFSERTRAMVLRAALVEDGWTVWMDNSAEEGGTTSLVEVLGVPPGQDYDELIHQAIEDAAYFVVLDSETYRSRRHCLEELEHAENCGKPVVRVHDVQPDLTRMRAHRDLADAHARLYASFRGDTVAAAGPAVRWLMGDDRAADARLLESADLSSTGMRLPAGADRVLATILSADQRCRWSRRLVGLGILAVLALLAGAATVAGIAAAEDRVRAGETRNAASSFALANRALRAGETQVALDLAEDALKKQRNDVSTAVQRQVEFSAAVERVVRVPAGFYYGIAASPDAATAAMVRRGAVVVVDVSSSRSTTIDSVVGLTRRVAVTSDDVWVIDVYGDLRVVDVKAGTIEAVQAGPYADLTVDSEGNLWLLAKDGTLTQRSPDADEPRTVEGEAVHGDALAVDAELGRVYVVWGSTVKAYEYETVGGSGPVLSSGRWMAGFDDATPELDSAGGGSVNSEGYSDISVCGHDVAVAQPWTWTLFKGHRLLKISSDGAAAEHWDFATAVYGSGCGVDGSAWTVGLNFDAVTFDPSGWRPESLTGMRVARAITALPDGRTVLVESTGILRIYSPQQMAWSREEGARVFAQPLSGGMVYVDDEGTVIWDPEGHGPVTVLGKLDGMPLARSAASSKAWWIVVAGGLVRITPDAAGESIHVHGGADEMADPTLSPDASTVCAHTDNAAICLPSSGDVTEEARTPVPVEPDERVLSAEWNDDRFLVTTNYGRILLLDSDGHLVHEVLATPGASVATFASTSGEVVAATGDGFLRRYDRDLREVRAAYVQTGGVSLRRVDDTHLLLGTSSDYQVTLVDTESVQIVAVLLDKVADLRRVVPDPSGSWAVSMMPFLEASAGTQGDQPGRLTVVPMPGHDVVLPN